ncbi:AraC family transcriptional regulator, partial [Actinomadura adrarensis]
MRDHDLVAEMLAITPEVGPNEVGWPGLTAYRFGRPQAPQRAEVHSLALCCVVQGRKRFIVGAHEYICGPAQYLLLTRGMSFEAEILEASAAAPYLSFILLIDPALVRDVLVDLAVCEPAPSNPPVARPAVPAVRPHVSELGRDLGEVLLRLLRSLGD